LKTKDSSNDTLFYNFCNNVSQLHKTGDLKKETAFTDNRHSSLPAKLTTKSVSAQPISNPMQKYPTSGYMADRTGQLFHQNLQAGPLEKLKEFE
jgi:hypothetical protein